MLVAAVASGSKEEGTKLNCLAIIISPPVDEDEFVFKIDEVIDDEKIDLACTLVSELTEEKLTSETLDFIRLKLGL